MTGSHDRRGNARLEWNTQTEAIYSPDKQSKLLPCDRCGLPEWQALDVVSFMCNFCTRDYTLHKNGVITVGDRFFMNHNEYRVEQLNNPGYATARRVSDGEQVAVTEDQIINGWSR